MFPKRFSHWLAANQFCSCICWWRFGEVQSKIYVTINARHWAGRAVSDSHSSAGSQKIYTQMDRARRILAEGCSTYTHTRKTETADRMLSINDTRRENYRLLWSRVSKVKKWHFMIWAAKLWHRQIWRLLDERHFIKPVFQSLKLVAMISFVFFIYWF